MMKSLRPPILATKLLERLASGPHGDALAGDLIEQYREGRSAAWYWRQVLLAIVVCLAKDRTLGGPTLASLLVLLLMIASVGRHPSSLGTSLFISNITLLLGYGAFALWVWRKQRSQARDAVIAGAQTGVMLGAVLVASHAIEWFALDGNRTVQLARGAGSVLLALALFGAAGSAAWQRTRSLVLAVIAGLWCGTIGILILLSFALALNLAFERHAVAWLHQPFVASGLSDAGAFVVRNSLEAASEGLLRVPVAALMMSFAGCLWDAWLTVRSRTFTVFAACITPTIFVAGAAALWYADSLERAARPPFVMGGVMAAGAALCGAHPIWSSLSRRRRELAHRA
jgi:hypothetical protein